MAAELGVGSRVWIGWCPDHLTHGAHDGRLRTGTIVGGPNAAGVRKSLDGKGTLNCPHPSWIVDIDGFDGRAWVSESLLFPLDDDDDAVDDGRELPIDRFFRLKAERDAALINRRKARTC